MVGVAEVDDDVSLQYVLVASDDGHPPTSYFGTFPVRLTRVSSCTPADQFNSPLAMPAISIGWIVPVTTAYEDLLPPTATSIGLHHVGWFSSAS
jgi:hypothetical protein